MVCFVLLVKVLQVDYWKFVQLGDLYYIDSMKVVFWNGLEFFNFCFYFEMYCLIEFMLLYVLVDIDGVYI